VDTSFTESVTRLSVQLKGLAAVRTGLSNGTESAVRRTKIAVRMRLTCDVTNTPRRLDGDPLNNLLIVPVTPTIKE
jgi:hypothetical protein